MPHNNNVQKSIWIILKDGLEKLLLCVGLKGGENKID